MLHVQIQIVFLYYNLYLNTIIHLVRTPLSTASLPRKTFRTGITKGTTIPTPIPDKSADRSSLNHRRQHQSRHQPGQSDVPESQRNGLSFGNSTRITRHWKYLFKFVNTTSCHQSYKEALEIIPETPSCQPIYQTILSQFILTKLNYHQMTDIEDNIRELESVINKDTNPPRRFPPLFIVRHSIASRCIIFRKH